MTKTFFVFFLAKDKNLKKLNFSVDWQKQSNDFIYLYVVCCRCQSSPVIMILTNCYAFIYCTTNSFFASILYVHSYIMITDKKKTSRCNTRSYFLLCSINFSSFSFHFRNKSNMDDICFSSTKNKVSLWYLPTIYLRNGRFMFHIGWIAKKWTYLFIQVRWFNSILF